MPSVNTRFHKLDPLLLIGRDRSYHYQSDNSTVVKGISITFLMLGIPNWIQYHTAIQVIRLTHPGVNWEHMNRCSIFKGRGFRSGGLLGYGFALPGSVTELKKSADF